MIGAKKYKMLYEIQSAMNQYRRKDVRYTYTIAFDSHTSAASCIAKGSDSIYWFLFSLETMRSSDLKIIKDRIKADLERISTGTAIDEIKKELPLEKNGDVDIKAFLKRFKEENLNDEKA